MSKVDEYRRNLKKLDDWDRYLVDESRLPGPRANLELAEAVAQEGDLERFRRYLAYRAEDAPYGSALEFLPVCGVIGLGRILSEGRLEIFYELRILASDPRWRIREAVAIALQKFGDKDMDRLLKEMDIWSCGNLLERRAVIASLCEPRLLIKPEYTQKVLNILDRIMKDILLEDKRKTDEFTALRKALGYCWSVAVVAAPEAGKKYLEKWFVNKDKDIRWIMKENLKKNRLLKMDIEWTERWKNYFSTET
ncbi:MAG: HEAT repeat domain-containing protein [Syntrophomonadaceae bacterium]